MPNHTNLQRVLMISAYDFDHTIHDPKLIDPTNPSTYDCDQNGFLDGRLLAPELFAQQVEFAKQNNIPLYIITARPDNALHRNHIINCIESINGFHDGIGGFKKERIICLGIEEYSEKKQRPHVKNLLKAKLDALRDIHQIDYPYLPNSHVLFSDDLLSNIEPVAAAGYTTFLAKAFDPQYQHLRQVHDYMIKLSLPSVTTLGNWAVLLTEAQLSVARQNFESTEYVTPAKGQLAGKYWRHLKRPDYTTLAESAMGHPEQKSDIAKKLAILNDKRQILFTTDIELLEQHILKNAYGTVTSLRDLANKDAIILLGSEGQRKYTPLKNCLSHLAEDLKKTAIIGFPAESGVDLQPVGYEHTLAGARNRLKQLLCLRETLTTILNGILAKPRTIACLTVESGIDLLPVENNTMQIATSPLCSEDQSTHHFCDQTAILLDMQNTQYHAVTRPAYVHHTLVSSNKEDLMAWFDNGKPTEQFYEILSQWSWEMLARMQENSAGVFPTRKEGTRELTVSDLIEERLYDLLQPLFPKPRMGTLVAEQGLFAASEVVGWTKERIDVPTVSETSLAAYPKAFQA